MGKPNVIKTNNNNKYCKTREKKENLLSVACFFLGCIIKIIYKRATASKIQFDGKTEIAKQFFLYTKSANFNVKLYGIEFKKGKLI